jgi:hypothetical protein
MGDNFQRKTYAETDDYKIYLEEISDNVFIHVALYNATPAIVKEVKDQWAEVVVRMYFLGYEGLYAYTKDNRIIQMIGGATKVAENVKFQNDNYEVWKWDLS